MRVGIAMPILGDAGEAPAGVAGENDHMKLYYRPASISLAARMILHEGGVAFESEELDVFGKRTASGVDYLAINPFGTVPALEIEDGVVLTQPVSILQHCADVSDIAAFAPASGTVQRARLQEAIGVVGDLHRAIAMVGEPLIDDDQSDNFLLVSLSRKALVAKVNRLLARIDSMLPTGDHWLGDYTPADIYLFTVLRWIPGLNWDLVEPIDLSSCIRLQALMDRIASRPITQAALKSEELI